MSQHTAHMAGSNVMLFSCNCSIYVNFSQDFLYHVVIILFCSRYLGKNRMHKGGVFGPHYRHATLYLELCSKLKSKSYAWYA